MTALTPEADQLIRTYLDDLARMLEPMPASERAEILDQVREHIDAALAPPAPPEHDAAPTPPIDADRAREVLARVGTPGSIAAGSFTQAPAPHHDPVSASMDPRGMTTDHPVRSPGGLLASPWLPWAIVGTMVLAVFWPLGVVLIPAGIALFLASPLWSRRTKVVGAVAYLLPLVGLVVYLLSAGFESSPAASSAGSGEGAALLGEGVDIFLPASYDLTWTILLATPLWCASIAVVLAVIAHRRPRTAR